MPSMTLTCAICNLPMQRSKTSKPQGEAAHNACRSGGASTKSEYMRKWHAEYRAKHGRAQCADAKRKARGVSPDEVLSCSLCSEPLENIRTNRGRYPLHKACRLTAPEWMRRGWDKPPSAKVAAFRKRIERAALGTTGGKRVFVHGGCAWCGSKFTASAGVYCSSKCKVAASFKRRSGGKSFSVSPRVRAAIYERDSWTCQLCQRPVDATLHFRDNWSGSLDHIIPQSHMLIPDHSPSNLRLVHRMCNSMRGDGSNMTEAEFHSRITAHFTIAA